METIRLPEEVSVLAESEACGDNEPTPASKRALTHLSPQPNKKQCTEPLTRAQHCLNLKMLSKKPVEEDNKAEL